MVEALQQVVMKVKQRKTRKEKLNEVKTFLPLSHSASYCQYEKATMYFLVKITFFLQSINKYIVNIYILYFNNTSNIFLYYQFVNLSTCHCFIKSVV